MKLSSSLNTWYKLNSESCPVFEYAIFNYGLMFGSLELGVLLHKEITLDGLILDLGVFNYGFGYV